MNGPTLNQSYNRVLESWQRQGCSANPECEECGCDLTGKNVIELSSGWYCANCAETDDSVSVDYRQDERKQLGIE